MKGKKIKKPVDPTSAERQRRYMKRLKTAAHENKKTKKLKDDDGPVEVMLPAEFMNGVFHQLERISTTLELLSSVFLEQSRAQRVAIAEGRAGGATTNPRPFRSGQWHKRDGTVFGRVALPGRPNDPFA